MPRFKPSPARARMLQLPRDPALEREIQAVMQRQEAFAREISSTLRALGADPSTASALLRAGVLGNFVPR